MAEQEQRQGEQVKGSWASWVSVLAGPAASNRATGRLTVTSFQAGPLAGTGAQEVTVWAAAPQRTHKRRRRA